MKVNVYLRSYISLMFIFVNMHASQTPPPVPKKPAVVPEDAPLQIQLTSPKGSSNKLNARRPASLDKASRLLGITPEHRTPPSAKASKILGTTFESESDEKQQDAPARRMVRSSAPLMFTNSDAAVRLMGDISDGNLESVKNVMNYNTVNINEPVAEFDGQTPFERAIDLNQKDIAIYMIYHGADLTRKNRFGQTPAEMAINLNRTDITPYIIEQLPFEELDKKDATGKPLLVRTSELGNVDLVELLIKRGALVRMTDATGATPLIAAARLGHAAVVKKLLHYLSPLDAQDKRGFTALMWATLENKGDVVDILKKAGANDTLKSYNTKAILDQLTIENDLLPVEKRRSDRELQAEASRTASITYSDIKKISGNSMSSNSTSGSSTRGNSLQWLTQLMRRKQSNDRDLNSIFDDPNEMERHSPLSPASPSDQSPLPQPLSGKASKIFGEDISGHIRSSHSSSHSTPESTQTGQQNNTSASSTPPQGSPELGHRTLRISSDPQLIAAEAKKLMQAIDDNNKGQVRTILESALVDLDEPVTDYQESPLYRAIQQNKTDIAKMMLARGARFDRKNSLTGKTPLDLVIELYNRIDIAKPIIEQLVKEQRINTANEFGETLLYRAVDHGNDDLVKLLLKKGANPFTADSDGRTPLMVATKTCMESIMKQLLKCKPDLDQQDKYGWTALMWAAQNNKNLCARLLMDAGAQPSIKSKDKKAIVEMLMEENETLPEHEKLSDVDMDAEAELYGNKSFLVLNEAFHDRKSIISAVAKNLK